MTHLELIEKVKTTYITEFAEDPTTDETIQAFRKGMIFAFDYLIEALKRGEFPRNQSTSCVRAHVLKKYNQKG